VTNAVFFPATPDRQGASQALSGEQLDKSTIASKDNAD
jgi:hypothetical protein